MSWLEKLERAAEKQVKSHDTFISEEEAFRFGSTLPRTRYPYKRDVGLGLDSNVVMSPVNWILRNFTMSKLVMERRRDDVWETMDHELVDLLHDPNEFYGGGLLWKATLISFLLDGNAYWLKVRNRFGGPVRLWYLPHYRVEPKWPRDGSTFISHYEYRPRGQDKVDIQPRNLVHFRFGLDPENPRFGKSPVKPLLREVFTDEEASNFSASILRNMGVPGGIIMPKDVESAQAMKPGELERMKDYMKTDFTADRRGDWLALGSPTQVEQFGFDPNQLLLTNLRDISEERVCAALGVPAAVVGFGSGLQQTKVGATMREMRRLAWTSCIEPMQDDLSDQMDKQILPDFQSQLRRFRLRFDSSDVPAFGEEETERTRRIKLMVEGGILRVDRAQEMLGLEVDPEQDVYLRPSNATAVDPSGEPVNAPPQLLPGGDEEDAEGDEEDEEEEMDPETNGVRRSLAQARKILKRMEG